MLAGGPAYRLLIVDDDTRFAAALGALVEADGRFEIVATAADGAEGVRLVEELRPDVVTLDVDMPVLDGVEATRLIVEGSGTPIVLVTGSYSSERVGEALAAGAGGYVSKSRVIDELEPALVGLVRALAVR
jgi:DNA-binding NarL/FixJ family response regulator